MKRQSTTSNGTICILIMHSKAYTDAFMEVVEEDQGITWADGNIRMGDYILIVDSDTRVPTDCLLDAVSEMEHSPEVAIIQFSSGVMNVRRPTPLECRAVTDQRTKR